MLMEKRPLASEGSTAAAAVADTAVDKLACLDIRSDIQLEVVDCGIQIERLDADVRLEMVELDSLDEVDADDKLALVHDSDDRLAVQFDYGFQV